MITVRQLHLDYSNQNSDVDTYRNKIPTERSDNCLTPIRRVNGSIFGTTEKLNIESKVHGRYSVKLNAMLTIVNLNIELCTNLTFGGAGTVISSVSFNY